MAETTTLGPARVPAPARGETLSGWRADGGDWPATNRVLPWALAIFLVCLWLVPIDAINLPLRLPFESTPDRVGLVALTGFWCLALVAGGAASPHIRASPVHWALLAFVVVATVSLVIGLERAERLAEGTLATKRLATLITYAAFFVICASTIRVAELRAFASLTLGLACLTAIGTVVEYNTDWNVFYETARALLPGGADIAATPGGTLAGRRIVVGPTQHGLAVTTMLAMTLPIAVARLASARGRGRRLLLSAAVVVLVAGTVSTMRKTGAIAPAVALVVICVYRPRAVTSVLGLLAVGVVAISLAAPGTLESLRQQLFGGGFSETDTTQGRLTDYPALAPDVLHHLLLGRGYGTYDVFANRILDNQYLNTMITVGAVGTAAFVAIIIAAIVSAHSRIRARDDTVADAALAAATAAVVFALVSAFFDSMAFPQVPYLFLFFAAAATVARSAGGASRPSADRADQDVRSAHAEQVRPRHEATIGAPQRR